MRKWKCSVTFLDLLLFQWFSPVLWHLLLLIWWKRPWVLICALLCSFLLHDPSSKFWFIRKPLHTPLFFFLPQKRMASANKRCLHSKTMTLLSMWQILFGSSKPHYNSAVLSWVFPSQEIMGVIDLMRQENQGTSRNLSLGIQIHHFNISKVSSMCISSPNIQSVQKNSFLWSYI